MVGRLEATFTTDLFYLLFESRVFLEYHDFAAGKASEMVMVMMEDITQLKLRVPPKTEAIDDSQFIEQFDVAIDCRLILVRKITYQFVDGKGAMFLKHSEQAEARTGIEVAMLLKP